MADREHFTQSRGDMLYCLVCHRSWSMDERGADIPPCEPVEDLASYRPPKPAKRQGWRGPGDHGKTSRRTRHGG